MLTPSPVIAATAGAAAPLPMQPAVELERRASLDDMLDDLEEKDDASVVLMPKVLTASELQEQKKQAQVHDTLR